MVRVLLADDHNLVRMGIKQLLMGVGDIDVVAEAKSGEEAIALAKRHRPDIILMDVTMPGIGGLEATRRLRRLNPNIKVVVLSIHVDGPIPERMLDAGATGYLTKGCDPQEMLSAITAVHRGEYYVCAEIAQLMVKARIDGSQSPMQDLSRRELQVLMMVAQGRKIQEIASQLCLSPKTVSTYRTRLFKKLGARTDVELTHIALRHGVVAPQGVAGPQVSAP